MMWGQEGVKGTYINHNRVKGDCIFLECTILDNETNHILIELEGYRLRDRFQRF